MKKTTTLFIALLMVASYTYADGDWLTSLVSLTKNNGSAYLYVLNSANGGETANGTFNTNTSFNNYDFGSPSSLILNGGAGNAWAGSGDYYNTTSFKMYYRVYLSSGIAGSWASIDLDYGAYYLGNNCTFDKSNANIDLMALATVPGTNIYTIEVVISKNQLYTGGSWNSMIPGGQSVGYSASTAGYIATFSKSIATDINHQLQSNFKISTQSGQINVQFDGIAQVELYTITGQLIRSALSNNQFTQSVKKGIYLIRINGQTHKVLIQ